MTQFKRMLAVTLAALLVLAAMPLSVFAEEDGMDWSDEVHVHSFGEATCTTPATCSCGATQGGLGDHAYMFPCDAHCAICGELTNEDAAHNVTHVTAVEATCQANGNIEYWICSDCGAAWSDEALTKVTNRMSIVTFTDHVYVDGACKWCGEADPDAPQEEVGKVVANRVAGTVTFTVYEMSDGSHKLVVSGTGIVPAWNGLSTYSATLKRIVIEEGIVNIGYGVFQNLAALETVTLPSTLTTINGAAFNNDKNLSSINLEEGLTTIGYKAFYGTGLIDVTIPDSVVTMGTWVFADCKQLTTVTFGASKLAKKTLPSRTFSGCTALKNVDLGSRLSTIDDYAFFTCGLEELYIPANIKVIDNAAFYGSASLKTVEIADGGATYLGWASFYRCTALESIDLGNSVTTIATWVFTACANLTSIEFPETVTAIGRRTFSWCNGLESVVLPSGVSTVSAELFYANANLSAVVLPEAATSIGNSAFYNCAKLESIRIPANIATIGSKVFINNESLKTVYVDSAKVAAGLTSQASMGYVIAYANKIALADGIAATAYITKYFKNVSTETVDGVTYTVYSK